MNLWNTAFTAIVVACSFSLSLAEPPATNQRNLSVSPEKLVKDLQLIARRLPVTGSKLEREDTLLKLRSTVADESKGVSIEYQRPIKSVDWTDGMATIATSSPVTNSKQSSSTPIKLTMWRQLKIPMSREDAMALKVGQRLRLRGQLTFLTGTYNTDGTPPTEQYLFLVEHGSYLSGFPIGLFVTRDYSIAVDDKDLISVKAK